ncbi:MAG: calcium-binding protein [Quinella sp. 1Q7]|nr:calcium-binding protein [Quinella sp. 1Q7]
MATQQGIIKTFMAALDKTPLKAMAALDTAIQVSSAFTNTQAVINQLIKDCKSYIAADKKNGWDKFLREKCGINLSNTDTGAITGLDAGGSKKTSENIVPESGSLKKFTDQSFTVNGLTFTLDKPFKKLSAKEKFIWQGLYTWWAKGALDLIKTSYGYSFTDSDVHFKKITVSFVEDNSTTELAWNDYHDRNSDGKADGKVDAVELVVNMRYYKNIVTTNPNGYSKDTKFYLDKTLAHELTHTLMHAKVLYGYELPKFIKEGWAELTAGIDDERAGDITYLAKNPSVLSNTLNGKSDSYAYSAGYVFMRYLAKQAATGGAYTYNAAKAKSLVGTAGKDSLNNAVSGATIQAFGGNDKIYNAGTKTKIFGGTGDDTIYNYGATVTIDGGNDNDKIYNENSTVKIFGGAGNDSIYNYGAKKVTLDGGNDKDHIYNEGANVSIFAGTGDDTIYNHGAKVTIDGGNDDDKIYNYATSTVKIFGGDGDDSITNLGAASSMSGGNGNDVIYGNDKADTILGGYGDDFLRGYKGNDKLWGGAGNDTFIYKSGDGKDVIYGFEDNDLLKITGTFSAPTYNKSDKSIAFKVGKGSVTLRDFGTTTTFHINDTTYQLSGGKLVKS